MTITPEQEPTPAGGGGGPPPGSIRDFQARNTSTGNIVITATTFTELSIELRCELQCAEDDLVEVNPSIYMGIGSLAAFSVATVDALGAIIRVVTTDNLGNTFGVPGWAAAESTDARGGRPASPYRFYAEAGDLISPGSPQVQITIVAKVVSGSRDVIADTDLPATLQATSYYQQF